MAEKFFSVVAELADGSTKVVPVRAEAAGAAFREVRVRADVRRVGRVTEITPDAYEHLERGEQPPANEPAPRPSGAERRAEPSAAEPPTERHSARWVDHVISGPRTVVYVPPRGGEQPFKHLVAPPERPKPPAPAPQPGAAQQPPAAAKAPAARDQAALPADAPSLPLPATAETEYRISKSRRQDGLPYLLQRGRWQQLMGKRAFEVQWEKGFEGREQAERHLEWVKQTERELTDFQQSA